MSPLRLSLRAASALLLLSLVGLPACGESGEQDPADSCETAFDCSLREACIAGRCIPRACDEDDDCPGGRCSGGECINLEASSTPPTGTSVTPDSRSTSDSSGNGNGSGGATDVSTPPPVVPTGETIDPEDCLFGEPPFCIVALDPEPGRSDLPRDFTWRATFSQSIDPTILGGGLNFSLRTIAGAGSNAPDLSLSVDPDAPRVLVARITDLDQVRFGSYYRLQLGARVRARSGAELGIDFNWPVRTALHPGREYLQALATHWAPVLHQEIEDLRIDTFTQVDFDGDLDARNNLDNATNTLPPRVYWSVSSTETHWFIHYFLYYTGGVAGQDENRELKTHDTLTINLMVRRDADTPFGALEAAWTWNDLSPENFYAQRQSQLPPERTLDRRGQLPNDRRHVRLADSDLEDGRHLRFLITAGRHQICLAGADRNVRQEWAPCGGSTAANAPFRDGFEGRIFRVGEGDTPEADVFGDGLTYALLPFDDELWLRRDLNPVGPRLGTPPDGGALFETPSPYLGPDDRPPQRPEEGDVQERFPRHLLTPENAEGRTDNARAAMPFAYSSFIRSGSGVGIVDPAWLVHEALTTDDAFSLEYCFQIHQHIDRRESDPERCAFPELPAIPGSSE